MEAGIRRASTRLRNVVRRTRSGRAATSSSFGPSVRLAEGARLERGTKLGCPTTVGRFSRVNGAMWARGEAALTIGAFCAIGNGLRVITNNHDTERVNQQGALHRELGHPARKILKAVTIGSNVWIGDSVFLTAGAVIGDGAVIGAGAVVAGEIPPFVIAGGVPARPIGRRCSEELARALQDLAWWDWPIEKIHANAEFFDRRLVDIEVAEVIALSKWDSD